MKSLSIVRLIIFLLVGTGLTTLYYRKFLKVGEGVNKKLQMGKYVLGMFILFGLLSIFSTVEGEMGKFIILLVVLLIINVVNINHSVVKCNFPTLYKINLFGRSSLIIIVIAALLYYSYEDNFFRFLYAESELDSSSKSTTNKYTVDELEDKFKIGQNIPKYCPDMDDDKYKTTDKWKRISPEKRNNCLASHSAKYERDDITNKIYA
jgi:hypothetical protein|tara:strand:+ start:316 stop:936 length:621 start_codon:yes stop_codon:yes gene_type:complete